ncbi:hypothetical protein [Halorussus marinus]|uniref:hypothetical protein n=1 Tax=Halorussus marinus TaxID=2505976 RepID=UPI0010930297|nr:hypothetical protein [Halorussus marinus]
MSDVPNLDWAALIWETQGFLGLDTDEPVPKAELKETALANGWTEREFNEALRSTDDVEAVGDSLASNPDLQLVAGDDETVDEPTAEEAADAAVGADRLRDHGHNRAGDHGTWADAEFASPESNVWPAELLDREQWMGHVDKKPFAPWGDRNAPAECSEDGHDTAATCDCDARWKWGYTDHYVDGETVAMAEVDNRLDGRAFLQQPDDPYVYIDGDDVRDENGEVHPAFEAILEHLGLTYADVSTSGAGAHAIYRGELPDGVKQASWQIDDEPWGDNDELPSIEVYPGKRVCVMTGEHIPGTPTEVREWNDDVLDALLEANDEVASSQRGDVSTARDDYDLDDYEPAATSSEETTDDIRDIFAAIDRLDARRVAERTIVHAWNDTASTSDGKRAFVPTWGKNSNGTANVVDDQIWQDTGDRGGYGGPVVMALIDAGEMRPENASPRQASGELWWRGIENLRDLGFDIPELERSTANTSGDTSDDRPALLDDAFESEDDVESQPVSSLPVGQLEHLSHEERKRAAKKRGLDWPSTREARDQLFATITQVMRNEDTAVVDAPTSLGKSHTVATTAWNSNPSLNGVAGGAPVIHLQATRDARDEAIEAAQGEDDIDHFVLRARHEACTVAAGDYDPPEDDEDIDYTPITMDGMAASEWIKMMCEGRGLPFSHVHRRLEDHNDQGADLPCCSGQTTYDEDEGDFDETPSECPAIRQWETFRNKREEGLDVVFATHNFAHVPGLRMGTNIVIDEEPDFVQDMDKQRVEEAVTAYLQAIDAPVTNWESFITLARHDGYQGDAANERDALQDALDQEPPAEHYFEDPRAHTMAPALARAIFHAEDRGNGRRVGKTSYEPPRLDAQVSDEDGWNREWVSVVLSEDNELWTVRCAPDFSQARSVVGLDAHPARPKWAVDVHPNIHVKEVLDPEARQLWRRFERGLRVVQVGTATRPLASGEYFNEDQVRALVEHLQDEYGHQFRTAITTNAVESRVRQLMKDAGCVDPETMHYGEEKSRNDFAHERAGLVNGCIDPGDHFVLDLLAELDLDAEPETTRDDDGTEHRAHGRGFVGEDAEVAKEILASVRENHTAQAAGRYARDPSDPDSHATVFVRTDAMPAGFADVQVSGVEWVYTDTQREIVESLRDATGTVTAADVADEVGCSKEHVRTTFTRLEERDLLQAFEGAGPNGATLYADDGCPNSGMVDVQPSTTNSNVWESYTASLAIRDPVTSERGPADESATSTTARTEVWDWQSASDPPS